MKGHTSMSRSLEIEYGNWYTPSEAAPHLPGLKNPKAVREACARDEIEHVAKTGEIDSRTAHTSGATPRRLPEQDQHARKGGTHMSDLLVIIHVLAVNGFFSVHTLVNGFRRLVNGF
jgi:hypothetical protein